jgi:hypothetical protein
LKRLHAVELEVVPQGLEVLDPDLERLARADLRSALGEDEIFVDEPVDGVRVLRLLPNLAPEVFDERDAVTGGHGDLVSSRPR